MPKAARPEASGRTDSGTASADARPTATSASTHPKVIERTLAMRSEGASVAAIGRAMEMKEATVLR